MSTNQAIFVKKISSKKIEFLEKKKGMIEKTMCYLQLFLYCFLCIAEAPGFVNAK